MTNFTKSQRIQWTSHCLLWCPWTCAVVPSQAFLYHPMVTWGSPPPAVIPTSGPVLPWVWNRELPCYPSTFIHGEKVGLRERCMHLIEETQGRRLVHYRDPCYRLHCFSPLLNGMMPQHVNVRFPTNTTFQDGLKKD